MFAKIQSNPVLTATTTPSEDSSLYQSSLMLSQLCSIACEENCDTFMVAETGEVFSADEILRAMTILELIHDNNTFVLSKQQE